MLVPAEVVDAAESPTSASDVSDVSLVLVLVLVLVEVSKCPSSLPELDGQYVTPCSAMIASIFSMTHPALPRAVQRAIVIAWRARRLLSFMT